MQWLDTEQYGNSEDGSKTFSSNQTYSVYDSTCSGTSSTKSLSATNANFEEGQIIFIMQTQGTNTGDWELNVIDSYTEGTITTKYDLANTYTCSGDAQAQVVVMKQYSSVTVNNGVTLSTKTWGGNVGGITGWFCDGKTTVNGVISADYDGFDGGNGSNCGLHAWQGESIDGDENNITNPNNGGGGGGSGGSCDGQDGAGSGGGASYGTAGTAGETGGNGSNTGGDAGETYGSTNLSSIHLGSGGGGGGGANYGGYGGDGGNGAGLVVIFSKEIDCSSGYIYGRGQNGENSDEYNQYSDDSGGGGGSGGSILIKCATADLGTNRIVATGGSGGAGGNDDGRTGGSGGSGRIALYYGNSYSGSTNPTMSTTQNGDLSTTTSTSTSTTTTSTSTTSSSSTSTSTTTVTSTSTTSSSTSSTSISTSTTSTSTTTTSTSTTSTSTTSTSTTVSYLKFQAELVK